MKSKRLFTGIAFCCSVLFAKAQPPKAPGIEERLAHVTGKLEKEIELTSVQKEKIKAAYQQFFASMEKLRDKDGKQQPPPPPPPPPADKAAVEKLSNERDAQIRKVLSAAQYAKYTEIEKTMRPPGPGKPGMPPMPKKD
ncbi:MAG: hypothetical protein KGO92_04110 [Bacteroidota bacterium]|nr:hypothetical protein [Bacteroidota bacterium]